MPNETLSRTASYARIAVTQDEAMNTWLRGLLKGSPQTNNEDWTPYLSDPNFNFMADLRRRAESAGFRGERADAVASEIFEELAFSGGDDADNADGITSFPGSLWRYKPSKNKPLDGYWKHAADNRIKSRMRNRKTERGNMPTVSITPRKDDSDKPGGISEGTLGGGEVSPIGDMAFGELSADLRDHLSVQRNGDRLVQIFDLMVSDPEHPMKQSEIAQATGMSPGQVNHWTKEIERHLKNFVKWDTPELSRNLYDLLADREKPTAPKGPKSGIYTGPSGTENIPVTVVRSGLKSIAIKRTDGQPFDDGSTQKTVPINQYQPA